MSKEVEPSFNTVGADGAGGNAAEGGPSGFAGTSSCTGPSSVELRGHIRCAPYTGKRGKVGWRCGLSMSHEHAQGRRLGRSASSFSLLKAGGCNLFRRNRENRAPAQEPQVSNFSAQEDKNKRCGTNQELGGLLSLLLPLLLA